MKHTVLFRLDNTSRVALDTARLEAGLRTHLRFAGIHIVWMHVAGRTQLYIATQGCEGCSYERCEPGCYGDLLCRLLRASLPIVRITPVRHGLAARFYKRAMIAWPRAHATLPGLQFLNAWDDARLSLSWSRSPKDTSALTACLLVGEGHPKPEDMLGALGWRTLELPRIFTGYLGQQAFPNAFWPGIAWRGALLPAFVDQFNLA